MKTRPISSPSKSEVADALGGPATRPPQGPTIVRAPKPADPLAAAREAFKSAHTTTAPAAEPAPVIGNPTFDPVPETLQARRDKVAAVRQRVGSLILTIHREVESVGVDLADLEDDAAELKAAEAFDPAEVRTFLGSLINEIDALAHPAPKKPKAEKPADA
jgi:hypothetical protein